MKSVLLCSSGIDSHCIKFLEQPDISLYFDLGSVYNKQEIKLLPNDVIVDTSFILNHRILPNFILPRRNAFLILGAAFYGDEIILGTTAGDTTKDKDFEFVSRMNSLLAHMGNDPGKATRAIVTIPYATMTKTEIVKMYIACGGDVSTLLKGTRSCYENSNKECGSCRSCIRKYTALTLNGIDCTNHFLDNPRLYLVDALEYAISKNRGSEINEIREVIKHGLHVQ